MTASIISNIGASRATFLRTDGSGGYIWRDGGVRAPIQCLTPAAHCWDLYSYYYVYPSANGWPHV